jgi:hypothetical protein
LIAIPGSADIIDECIKPHINDVIGRTGKRNAPG